jgi:lipoic acid synthetase
MQKKPNWFKVKFPGGENYREVKSLLKSHNLHTVCQEAKCPNIGECFESRTATFLISGKICTRNCSFCNVEKGIPQTLERNEPKEVAQAVKMLNLNYAVITSVTRDDLKDGGAYHFAATIKEIKKTSPQCQIEVLVPDFGGSQKSLEIVLKEKPYVLNHNLETVKRLYPLVRSKANYERSLELLKIAKELDENILTKSGIMVGLGEKWEEILEVLKDLRKVKCDIVTIGQYLAPSEKHFPVAKFLNPEEFQKLKEIGEKLGFAYVESGPLVRSSYKAETKKTFEKEKR